jgi:hypothetical protein
MLIEGWETLQAERLRRRPLNLAVKRRWDRDFVVEITEHEIGVVSMVAYGWGVHGCEPRVLGVFPHCTIFGARIQYVPRLATNAGFPKNEKTTMDFGDTGSVAAFGFRIIIVQIPILVDGAFDPSYNTNTDSNVNPALRTAVRHPNPAIATGQGNFSWRLVQKGNRRRSAALDRDDVLIYDLLGGASGNALSALRLHGNTSFLVTQR